MLGSSILLSACSTISKKGSSDSRAHFSEPVTIEFKGRTGETTETRYFSNAQILSYQDQQLLRDRRESVDFTVSTHVSEIDSVKKTIHFEARTIRKDGTVPLHDLAFPELNEQVDYVVRSNGQVLRAGLFSPNSLFFVPSMPIPNGPVKVGDTWTMEHTWKSAQDEIPLKLEVVGILKDVVACEKTKLCADVEVSGHVKVVAVPADASAKFKSRIWGRMLFSLERGDVIWSEMRSQEEMGFEADRMQVTSCMLSETKLSADYKIKFDCEPGEMPVNLEARPK